MEKQNMRKALVTTRGAYSLVDEKIVVLFVFPSYSDWKPKYSRCLKTNHLDTVVASFEAMALRLIGAAP